MTVRAQVLKGGLLLTASQLGSQLALFLSNVVFARMLSLEDMGVAAVLTLTTSLVDLLSDLSINKLLIQSADGNDPAFQATAQTVAVIRGACSAVVVLALSWPLAWIFSMPQALWAFQCLSFVPLIRGLFHQDVERLQREMRFLPAMKVEISSVIWKALLAWPLAWWFHSYAAVLWASILQVSLSCALSHYFAERPFRLQYRADYAKRILSFGWPLLINGGLMFLIIQGDRLVIGLAEKIFPHGGFTLADLGGYAQAYVLSLVPTMIGARVASTIFLPPLARATIDASRFVSRFNSCTRILCFAATLLSVFLIVAGDRLMVILYGEKYLSASQIFPFLSLMNGLRLMRVAPTVGALAKGDTVSIMIGNIARATGLIGVVVVAALGGSLIAVVLVGISAELAAIVVSLINLYRRHNIPVRHASTSVAIGCSALTLAIILHLVIRDFGPVSTLVFATAICFLVATVGFYSFPELRIEAASFFRSLRHRAAPVAP